VHGHDALEAVLQVAGVVPVEVGEADVVLLFLAGAPVVDAEAALAVGVDDVRIAGFGDDGAGLAAAVGLPGGPGPPGSKRSGRLGTETVELSCWPA